MIQLSTWPDDVAVLIPAYKAEKSLQHLLPQLITFIPVPSLCVVDDGSHDGTDTLCKNLNIKCVVQARNQGKGAALVVGFQHLMQRKCSWILTLDADGQHAPTDISQFLDAKNVFSNSGIIIGKRQMTPKSMPIERIFSNVITSGILTLFCGQLILDSQCGFRLYSTRLLSEISLQYKRFETESEVILKACALRYPIRFVQIKTLYCSMQSHMSYLKDIIRWIRAVVHIRLTLPLIKPK